MKSGFTIVLAAAMVAAALPAATFADDRPMAPATSTLTNQADRISYSVGVYLANTVIKRNNVEVDVDVMAGAIKDVLQGRELKLTEQQAMETLRAYDQELRAKREQQRIQLAEKNRQAGQAFLDANKLKPGVKTHEVKLSETNTAELQYKVLAEGAGDSPKIGDTVMLNLKGMLPGGKEFDNGVSRKTPLNRLPPGLREALQLMKPGSKWDIFLPSTLAFGDVGSGQNVEPGSAVIYQAELLSVETPQPLTSDVIEVPSKEMLDKGAQIKVYKPEDLKKLMMTNNAPAPMPKP